MRDRWNLQALAAAASALALMLLAIPASGAEPPDPSAWRGHTSGINSLAVRPDGREAVTCGLDGTVRIWDVASGRALRAYRSGDAELYSVGYSGGGTTLVTTGDKGRVTVLDAASGKILRELPGLKGWSADLAVSPDGRLAAAWGQDGRILIWDIDKDGPPRILEGEANKWGLALAWSPDGRVLAAGRASIALWDVEKGARAGTLTGPKDFVRDLAFSRDGRFLATAGLDKTVRVWELADAREIYALEPEGFVHPSMKGPVTEPIRVPLLAVAFSPDGKILASGGADRLVRLWDAGTGKFLRSFQGHTMTITALAFVPDGKTLLSAGLDRTVRSWKLEEPVR